MFVEAERDVGIYVRKYDLIEFQFTDLSITESSVKKNSVNGDCPDKSNCRQFETWFILIF